MWSVHHSRISVDRQAPDITLREHKLIYQPTVSLSPQPDAVLLTMLMKYELMNTLCSQYRCGISMRLW